MRRNIILMLITIAATFGFYIFTSGNSSIPKTPTPTESLSNKDLRPAPEFTTRDLNNKKISLSDFNGKVVLLHFWASWCAPCVVELPKLVALAKDYPKDIVILAISSDITEQNLNQFLTKKSLSTPPKNLIFIFDGDGKITQDLFQTIQLPETIILNPKLQMVKKIAGDAAWDKPEMRETLNGLMPK